MTNEEKKIFREFLPKLNEKCKKMCSDNAHGFIQNKSPQTNAIAHINKKFTLSFDLSDFFDTIKPHHLEKKLSKEEIAILMPDSCAYQGLPTSPQVSNLAAIELDRAINKCLNEKDIIYTRYADDITFSCNKARFDDVFLKKLNEIIISEGFLINEKKTRVQNKTVRQEVTGVTVNEKLNLQQDYIRNVRAMLHNWEKYGYENANAKFAKFYPREKGFMRNKVIPPLESVVSGKIMFLGMVRGKEDVLYKKYNDQLKKLIELKKSNNGR